jgi:peptidoglycan hydrolase-like protein with peptidoglycan-binding domain
MIKDKKIFWGAFAVIGLGAYFIYSYISKTKKGQTLSYTDSVKQDVKGVTSAVVNTVLPVAPYPLKNGSKGSNVVALQKWLNNNGYAQPNLTPDGAFGAKTESAVRNMQENSNTKAISDYVNNAIWSTDFSYGQVSQDFYTKFVK